MNYLIQPRYKLMGIRANRVGITIENPIPTADSIA
jgi:hypothetical protein